LEEFPCRQRCTWHDRAAHALTTPIFGFDHKKTPLPEGHPESGDENGLRVPILGATIPG
jgi:hypothetical protein